MWSLLTMALQYEEQELVNGARICFLKEYVLQLGIPLLADFTLMPSVFIIKCMMVQNCHII